MITSLVLALREGLEAALIVSIALGALSRIGRPELKRPLWLGVAAAVLLSLLAALGLRAIGLELEGSAEQIFEGVTMLVAAGLLTWMVFWMSRQARNIKSHLESQVKQASLGGTSAMFLLAFVAVLREGIELALFLLATSMASGASATLMGASLGLLSAGILGYLLYTATIRLNLKRFFQVTGVLLILFAAGLIGHGIAEFNEAGIIPGVITPLWNLNPYLDDHSTIGSILGALFGYNGNPSLTQMVGYSIYLLIIFYFLVRTKKVQVG